MCFTAGLQVFYLRDEEQRREETDIRKAETVQVLLTSLQRKSFCIFKEFFILRFPSAIELGER